MPGWLSADKPVVFKAPKLSSNAERVSQGTKPRAQPGHKKHSTSSKQPSVSSKEATKSASGNDASTVSIAEADLGKSTPSDFIPQQHGVNEGTKNTSYDHLFASTDPHVLADQIKSISEGLETVLTQPKTGKVTSSISRQPSFKDMDSPEDDPIISVDENDEDKEADKVHATTNVEIKDTLVPKSSSPWSSQIQELTNQVLILQSQKHKLELEKNKVEVEAALLKAQPSFLNMGQLNELLVKSLQIEISKILSTHDFSSSLLTELKDLPSKFNELIEEVKGLKKQVHELEIELLGDLKEIPSKLEDFTKTVISLLLNVIKALNKFAQVLDFASSKAGDQSVPSAFQADTMPAEGEKNTNQVTIS
ncbi:hypothetical protein Tco_0255630 [Tanacetum coccineum]